MQPVNRNYINVLKGVNTISPIILLLLLLSFNNKEQHSPGLLTGKWDFIRFYQGKDIDLKDKKGQIKIWPDLDVYKFYNKDGSFYYREDDMIEEGYFIFDEPKKIIKEFNKYTKNADTVFLKVTYLDSNYLMYVDKNDFTFLYKKQ